MESVAAESGPAACSTPRKSKRSTATGALENITLGAKREREIDKLLASVDRCEYTMVRRQLFSNTARDGEEVNVPKDFVIVNHIISGPWNDIEGEVTYMCNVDGWFGRFRNEDWRTGVVYELYQVDIPDRMVAAFNHSPEANDRPVKRRRGIKSKIAVHRGEEGRALDPNSKQSVTFLVPFEGVNVQWTRQGNRSFLEDLQDNVAVPPANAYSAIIGTVIRVTDDIIGLVIKVTGSSEDGFLLHFIQYELVGEPLESTAQKKGVVQLQQMGTMQMSEAVQVTVSQVQIVPFEFWEGWMNYTPDFFLILGSRAEGQGVNQGEAVAVSRIVSTSAARLAWCSLHLQVRVMHEVIKTNVAYRVECHLLKKHKRGKAMTNNYMLFDNVPSSWLYAVLGRTWETDTGGTMKVDTGRSVMHEISGPCTAFTSVFGRDIGHTMLPCGTGEIVLGHREGFQDLTFRLSPRKSAVLLLVFDRVIKNTLRGGVMEQAWDSALAKKRSKSNAAQRPRNPNV
mmetsp:Transcript_24309/g.49248  ORF Transcript_24309/g.49248 Transcript_24309/m.49248 type:complete len:510 (-) Transcript_24309:72-1601(-)|eukprot:CAMPEP_0181318068 /NCGR_PEP_ID=MMETSP1101-20121128/16809_1 /TAXON_ID=46948 /ORGANISM="Rhodomonas abbreviata, Strain Caron Lab Isolate" /LENGTH=509 /DNA_ID=CAMNT_0023425513 /DNA_START=56 /DNA_END=1585 /DNA_ORIENTATION=-